MSRDRLKKTVLLALALVALLAVAAAPGAASQTERYNETFNPDQTSDAMVTLDDTGETTVTQYNSSDAIIIQRSAIVNDSSAIPVTLSQNAHRLTVSSDRQGATVIYGNLSTEFIESITSPMSVEIDTNTTVTALAIGYRNDNRVSNNYKQIEDGGRLSVNNSADGIGISWITSGSDKSSVSFDIIREYYNKTIEPSGSVESLRIYQSNAATIERSRVRIMAPDGRELINESLEDSQTSAGYGAVALDNTSEYRIIVTGINNNTDGLPNYSVEKLKSNSPVISIGPPGSSSKNTLIWLVIVVGGIALFLRTRD